MKYSRQPQVYTGLDKFIISNPLDLYLGSAGEIDLITNTQMTKGSAFVRQVSLVGIGSKQNAVNTGIYSSRVPPSLNGYVIVWHGIFLGTSSGSTPKITGIASSNSSQSIDIVGIEILSSTDLQINFKSGTSNNTRTFANSMPATGVPVTIVASYDSLAGVCRLHVCENGKLTSYTSSLISAPSSPTILGTEVFVVGPDVIEIGTRYPNNNTALSLIAGGVLGPEMEKKLASNPWQIFKFPTRFNLIAPSASADATAAPSGLSATWNVGLVSAIGNANSNPSGLNSSGDIGSSIILGNANISVFGLQTTGNIGSIICIGDGNSNINGLSCSSSIGSPLNIADATINGIGISADLTLGNVVETGDANYTVNGINATGNVGSPTSNGNGDTQCPGVSSIISISSPFSIGDANITCIGLSGAISLGDVIAGSFTNATANPSAVEINGSIGTVTVNGTALCVVTGLPCTYSIGNAVLSANALIGITGLLCNGYLGTVNAFSGEDVIHRTYPLSGTNQFYPLEDDHQTYPLG